MNEWNDIKYKEPKTRLLIDVRIRHCNVDLNLDDEIVTGYMGDDNFYFKDGSELSWNWDILEWRKH